VADKLDLNENRNGTTLRLRVKTGAKANTLLGTHGGALKLSVTPPPEKGKANKAVLELLAHALSLPAAELKILTGQSSQDKAVWVPLSPAEIERRLDDVLT